MMKIQEWPNKLGWNVGAAEVWKHSGKMRVFTETRVLLVAESATTDPAQAVAICRAYGLLRSRLDDMNHADAELLFQQSIYTGEVHQAA